MTEKDVEKSIIQWLQVNGFYCVKVQSGKLLASYGGKQRMINLAPQGTPDILACINGKFCGIEVKKDAKTKHDWWRDVDAYARKPSKAKERAYMQHEALERIDRGGGEGFLVCSVDDLEKQLTKSEHDKTYTP